MAPTKPPKRPSSKSTTLLHAHKPPHRKSKPPPSPTNLLAEASCLLSSSPPEALRLALRALNALKSSSSTPSTALLQPLKLLAHIQLELGDGDAAREYFLQAVTLDPEGKVPEAEGGGAEKFLWLAQLSEEGGEDSVQWFEQGCAVLRRQIEKLEHDILQLPSAEQVKASINDKKRKLASALCGIVEIYMTDLSLEPDAESQCDTLIAEALAVAPNSPEPLQTLASVRISQQRIEEAKEALVASVDVWKDADTENVPDFPTRISLSRLLMEVSMLDEARVVLERLVGEDDQSVEAWYLGGWCAYLAAETGQQKNREESLRNGREWLRESLRLYEVLEYEDERLREHAMELVGDLDRELGGEDGEDEGQEGGAEEWEDDDDDGDDEAKDDGSSKDQIMGGT